MDKKTNTKLLGSYRFILHIKNSQICDGCGEMHIDAGMSCMAGTFLIGGRPKTMRYCIRCSAAIGGKLKARGGCDSLIDTSSLKWSRLSSPFRRDWNEFVGIIKQAEEMQDKDEARRIRQSAIQFFTQHWGSGDIDAILQTQPAKRGRPRKERPPVCRCKSCRFLNRGYNKCGLSLAMVPECGKWRRW